MTRHSLLRQAQPAGGVGTPAHLAQQRFPVLARHTPVVEVGTGPLAPVVEEADVVVLLLQRLDLGFDEGVKLGQIGNQIGGSVTTNSDGTFTVTDLLSTKMFCEELNAAETTFSEILLGGALTFSQTEAGLVAQNSVGTLELAEAMYDAMPTNGEERANIDGVGASSDLSALLIAIALLGIPALVGAAGLSMGLSRRD